MTSPTTVDQPGLAALRRAIEFAGGQAALAKRLDEIGQRQVPALRCKPQNVWAWLNRDSRVPGEWARHVAEAVDFRVLPANVRPDIYPNLTDGLPNEYVARLDFQRALGEVAQVLRPDEHAALAAAFERGPQHAIREIEALELTIDQRAQLLAAAQRGEEAAA